MTTREDPLEQMTAAISRDLVTDAGLPPRLAEPIAQFAAASVCLLYLRTQTYFPESCILRDRDRRLRELNRRALASVDELVDLTGLERSGLYRILRHKAAGRATRGRK